VSDSEFADIRKRLTDAATLSSYRLGSLAARLMPGPMAASASASIGFGASFASPAKRRMIERHLQYTGSQQARDILDDWNAFRTKFVKVFPKEYQRALSELASKGSKLAA